MSSIPDRIFNHPFFWGKTDEEKQYLYAVWTKRAKRDPSVALPWTESYRKYYEKITKERMQRKRSLQQQRTLDAHPMADTIRAMRRVFEANFGTEDKNQEQSTNTEPSQPKSTSIISKGVWGSGMRASIKRGIITSKTKTVVSGDEKISNQLDKCIADQIVSFDIPPIFQSPSEWRKSLIKQCQNDFETDKKKRTIAKTTRVPDFSCVENPIVLKRANTIATIILKEKPILDEQLIDSMVNIARVDDFMWLVSVDVSKFGRGWYNPITWLGRLAKLHEHTLTISDYGKTIRGYLNLEKLTIPELEKSADHLLAKKYYHPETTSFVIKLTDRAKYCWIHFDRFLFTLIRWVQERQKTTKSTPKAILRTWINDAERMINVCSIKAYWERVKQFAEKDDKCSDYASLLCTAMVNPISNLGLAQLPESLIQIK